MYFEVSSGDIATQNIRNKVVFTLFHKLKFIDWDLQKFPKKSKSFKRVNDINQTTLDFEQRTTYKKLSRE